MHISKYQLEVLLSSCLRFADLRLSHTTFNDLEDQQLLDGDKDEVTIENLTQYIIDLI
jgi:hypothetical protein